MPVAFHVILLYFLLNIILIELKFHFWNLSYPQNSY